MSPARASAEALGSLLLMALAGALVAVSAILFVPLGLALLFGVLAGASLPALLAVAAGLFLAAWNCALATEVFADPAPARVAWLAARTLLLLGGCALALGGA